MTRDYRYALVLETKAEMLWAGGCFQEWETLELYLKFSWDFGWSKGEERLLGRIRSGRSSELSGRSRGPHPTREERFIWRILERQREGGYKYKRLQSLVELTCLMRNIFGSWFQHRFWIHTTSFPDKRVSGTKHSWTNCVLHIPIMIYGGGAVCLVKQPMHEKQWSNNSNNTNQAGNEEKQVLAFSSLPKTHGTDWLTSVPEAV